MAKMLVADAVAHLIRELHKRGATQHNDRFRPTPT